MKIVLASSSPRRKDLLESVGIVPLVVPARVEEHAQLEQEPSALVKCLAKRKVRAVVPEHKQEFVLGADTVVVIEGELLGKPGDPGRACRMLRRLSGKTHHVYTGVALYCPGTGETLSDYDCTSVTVKELSSREIEQYVATGEPLDKAGGYALQGVGAFLVQGIRGDHTGVIGLPLPKVYELLKRAGVSLGDIVSP